MKTIIFLVGVICFFLLFISVMLVAVFLEKRKAKKPQVFIAPKNTPETRILGARGLTKCGYKENSGEVGLVEHATLKNLIYTRIRRFERKVYNFQIGEIINFYKFIKSIGEKDEREIRIHALSYIPEIAFNDSKFRKEIISRVKYVFKFIKNYYDDQIFPSETLEHLKRIEKRESLILDKIEELFTKEHKDGGLSMKDFFNLIQKNKK